MSEFLEIEERIRLAVKIGESLYREFKSALEGPPSNKKPRDIKEIKIDVARTLVAFANADGGELLIGVEDDGTITGVPYTQEQIASILDAPSTHIHQDTPLPNPRKKSVEIDGKNVIYFNVTKGTQYVHLTSDGRCLKRIDRESVPVSSENIHAIRLEDQSRIWDRESAQGLTLADLDLDLIQSVASQIVYGVSIEKCLQYLDLAEFSPDGIRLKRASYILFAKDIRKWHAGCFVRIMTFKGNDQRSGDQFNIIKNDIIADNVLQLIDKAWERLNHALSIHTQLTETARFQQTLMYPQIACREALINAIVHRNYAIEGRGIEISIFQDRMEILSPGMLLRTISIEDILKLQGAHESRNPLIARVLREVGFVQEIGEGMRRIFNVMRSNSLAEPQLESTNKGFTVTLFHKSLYDPSVKLWLSTYDGIKLTENQKAIMALGYGGKEFSTQDIIDRLGIVDIGQITEIITPLRSNGLIQRTRSHQNAYSYAAKHRIPKREVPTYKVVDQSILAPQSSVNEEAIIQEVKQEIEDSEAIYHIFISNLPYSATKSQILEWLTTSYDVISFSMPDGITYGNENKGYAFASISSSTDEDTLIGQLDGYVMGSRRIHVRLQR